MIRVIGAVFKTIGSLVVVFVFFSMIVVKNAVSEEEGAVDNDPDTEGNNIYPPHMWKGMAMWLGVIYGIINLITIAIAFR